MAILSARRHSADRDNQVMAWQMSCSEPVPFPDVKLCPDVAELDQDCGLYPSHSASSGEWQSPAANEDYHYEKVYSSSGSFEPAPLQPFAMDASHPEYPLESIPAADPSSIPVIPMVPIARHTITGASTVDPTLKRARNAESARRSRARQTSRMANLQAKYERLTTDNMCLRYEVGMLRDMVKSMRESLASHGVPYEEPAINGHAENIKQEAEDL